MGIDSMRVGGGRCPPVLVGGLLVACLMLICNWWTLSSENIELVRQIDELNEQLKISAEERDQCVTLRGNLEKRYKHVEEEVASLHVRLDQQTDLKKKNEELRESINVYKTDLDSLRKLDVTKSATLKTLREDNDNFNTQLYEKLQENKKLQKEIVQLKDELDKVKLTCTRNPEKNPELTQQSKASPKEPNHAVAPDDLDGVEIEGPDDSKQGNPASADSTTVESDRDQQMKATGNVDK
ncbi:PREDICTED: Golgi membrane protein 1-like isoform X1 [Dufourea novaeangliae]|uniref:Golgi membrane protein 1-like isoform X1 n=1 Tax=Dufourea novaeangliae TaxID=178035 RepID=UPI000766F762|nr:PREDICTED: Golgi membrane protein 1-like isoform X1 [Dufourea novaeangliae]